MNLQASCDLWHLIIGGCIGYIIGMLILLIYRCHDTIIWYILGLFVYRTVETWDKKYGKFVESYMKKEWNRLPRKKLISHRIFFTKYYIL